MLPSQVSLNLTETGVPWLGDTDLWVKASTFFIHPWGCQASQYDVKKQQIFIKPLLLKVVDTTIIFKLTKNHGKNWFMKEIYPLN